MFGRVAPSRTPGEAVAALTSAGVGTCGADDNQAQAGHLIIDDDRRQGPSVNTEVTPTLTGRMGTGGNNMPMAFVKAKRAQSVEDDETWEPNRPAPTLNSFDNNHETRATVLTVYGRTQFANYSEGPVTLNASMAKRPYENIAVSNTAEPTVFGWQENQLAGNYRDDGTTETLTTTKTQAIHTDAVRRLTPIECERLMGWPDNWTATTADNKQQADSHRYRQTGNGVVSNVAQWIGNRLPT
jgi:DNA (cytosine-5)-methyltransferase 1